jgi:predicted TIM-barrel fold metal-dependent hydrolase
MEAIAVPQSMQWLSGRIFDTDGHEMMPSQEWVTHFGPEARAFGEASAIPDGEDRNHTGVPDYRGDVAPIGPDIGSIKGAGAPGATDPLRRLEVLDALGIRKQLMFPGSIGLYGFLLYLGKRPPGIPDAAVPDQAGVLRWMEIYNEWAIGVARTSDRLRPVLPLIGDTPEQLYINGRHLIDNGIKGLWIASGDLTGGRSPAHPDLDPLWSLMAESGTSGFLHGGGEGDFLATREWRNAPAFTGYKSMAEFDFDPWSMSIYHLPSQNYLTTLVLGGVFERHPKLHFGVAEVGSHWVGPMMAGMDLLHRSFQRNEANPLKRKPSDYVRSNVRVSVLYYEPIDEWIEQYEGLEDVLCFGTDYPHVEGGNDIIERFGKRLSRLGRDVSEKFFVTNGAALFG